MEDRGGEIRELDVIAGAVTVLEGGLTKFSVERLKVRSPAREQQW